MNCPICGGRGSGSGGGGGGGGGGGPEFWRTIIGREFLDRTMPGIWAELKKLNKNLERVVSESSRPRESNSAREDGRDE